MLTDGIGKSGFDVIRFAFKRLPNQEPLVNGQGEVMPEPDYDSEEWKGWEARLTNERAEEVVAIKKEESPIPEEFVPKAFASSRNMKVKVKLEED